MTHEMSESEAREILARYTDAGPNCFGQETYAKARGVLHGLSLGRKEAEGLVEALKGISETSEEYAIRFNMDSDDTAARAKEALDAYNKERQNNG